jgi:hypothetical protein
MQLIHHDAVGFAELGQAQRGRKKKLNCATHGTSRQSGQGSQSQIVLASFKRLEMVQLGLNDTTVLIGANNSGKSGIL